MKTFMNKFKSEIELREKCLTLFDKKFKDIKDKKDFGKIMNSEVYTTMTARANYKESIRNKILFSSNTKILNNILLELKEVA